MIRFNFLLVTLMLSMPTFCAMAQETKTSPTLPPAYSYSITNNDDGSVAWAIRDSTGAILDLPPNEKRRILREVCFPGALERAEAGKTPDVWTIGFFYMDDGAIEKDLEAAEAAFRRGLKVNRPDGLLFLASIYHKTAAAEELEDYFQRANELYLEVCAAELDAPASNMIALAHTYMHGSYGVKQDFKKAEKLLAEAKKTHPEDPLVQLKIGELYYNQERYAEAIDSIEIAEKGLFDQPEELRKARAYKIASALLGGMISRIDSKDVMELGMGEPGTLGLTGPVAWSILVTLCLSFGVLLWRTRRSLTKEPREGPGLRLTLCWIFVCSFGAGIGFIITLPGLENLVGRWIGAVVITAACLIAMTIGGWPRYFGNTPIWSGRKGFLIGLGILVGCIVGQMIVMLAYQEIYERVMGKGLDQQMVTLFMKSENLWQLTGILLIVGIAIPFYEEVLFRGFLFDAVNRRWGTKIALVVSSVVFAIVHGPIFAIPLMFLAFALGWIRIKTGNLKMGFLLHAANNSFATLAMYFGAS